MYSQVWPGGSRTDVLQSWGVNPRSTLRPLYHAVVLYVPLGGSQIRHLVFVFHRLERRGVLRGRKVSGEFSPCQDFGYVGWTCCSEGYRAPGNRTTLLFRPNR